MRSQVAPVKVAKKESAPKGKQPRVFLVGPDFVPASHQRAKKTALAKGAVQTVASNESASAELQTKKHVERVRVVLQLSPAQQRFAHEVLEAPFVLAQLLKNYQGRVWTTEDASHFLLVHRRQLEPYLHPDRRSEQVDMLKSMLVQWAHDPPEIVGVDFELDVSISGKQEFHLPLEGLRNMAAKEPENLLSLRRGARYEVPFTLYFTDGDFYMAFNLVREARAVSTGKRPKPTREMWEVAQKEVSALRAQRLTKASPKRSAALRPLYAPQSQRGAGGGKVRGMNWAALGGWGVSGGLPSLGRRSR